VPKFAHKVMSCILRVFGEQLDVEALLAKVTLKPDRIWRKGEPRFKIKPNGQVNEQSGVTFVASDANFHEPAKQLEDATRFLEDCHDEIVLLVEFEGVEHATLDFGIELRDVAVHCDCLSPRFLRAAASAGIEVELSHYPISEKQRSEHDGGGDGDKPAK